MISLRSRAMFLFKSVRSHKRLSSIAPSDKPVFKEAATESTVYLQGWVKAVRNMKNLLFLNIDDGKSPNHMQVVVPKSFSNEDLTYGASVKVRGHLGKDLKGNVEIRAENIEVIGKCDVTDNYPFLPKHVYSEEYVRKFLHMRSRTDSFSALLRIRDAAYMAVHNFFHSDGFCLVNTPILTSSDCEGAGEVFSVKPNSPQLIQSMAPKGVPMEDGFFNKKVFLSVSGQLQLEAAVRYVTAMSMKLADPLQPTPKLKMHIVRESLENVRAANGIVRAYNLSDFLKKFERVG